MTRLPGGRKLKMEKIECTRRRHVSFSKRRAGLYKKAHKLSSLYGDQVALLIPSISGKTIYSFGSPGVYQVIDRFENPDAGPVFGENDTLVKNLSQNLEEIEEQLKVEMKKAVELKKKMKRPDLPPGLAELEKLKRDVTELEVGDLLDSMFAASILITV